jgi:hypothetical protein
MMISGLHESSTYPELCVRVVLQAITEKNALLMMMMSGLHDSST